MSQTNQPSHKGDSKQGHQQSGQQHGDAGTNKPGQQQQGGTQKPGSQQGNDDGGGTRQET